MSVDNCSYQSNNEIINSKPCECITKIHFGEEDICIQDFRPYHYESDDESDSNQVTHSPFVQSIIDSRAQTKQIKEESTNEKNNVELIQKLFKEIKIGFSNDSTLEQAGNASM